MIGFHMRMQHGLIRSLTSSFSDARWPARHSVPKLVIGSCMADETAHKVKVPGATPGWLEMVRAKMKAGCKHKCIKTSQPHSAIRDESSDEADEFDESDDSDKFSDNESNDDPDANDAGSDSDSASPPAKRKLHVRTRSHTQSQTWSVCVIRRSISWLTMSGQLVFTPLISPPSPMRLKGAEYLWNVGVWGFPSHGIFSNPKQMRRITSGMFPYLVYLEGFLLNILKTR